jgi:NitT/TauT family transport system permease protein
MRRLRQVLSPIAILLIWEACSRSGLADPLLIPPPTRVFADIGQLLISGELFGALWASFRRIFIGFSLAVICSVPIGALMARLRAVDDLVNPLVELVRPISPLAIYPLALLWFGLGDGSKIFLIALSCCFPIILNTYAGVKSIDVALVRASMSLGANPAEIFRRIILPGSLPHIFTGVRIAWGIALIVIIATEMVGAIAGIGHMILYAQQTFLVPRVYSGIVVIGVLGFLTDLGLRALRRRIMPWYKELSS